jgi:hypothetical protein
VNTHMHPHFINQLSEIRQRRRIARQFARHGRASRIEQRAERRMSRATVKVLRLRSELLP